MFDLSSICVDGESDYALRWGRGRQGFRAVRVTQLGLDHVDSVGRSSLPLRSGLRRRPQSTPLDPF